MALKFKIVLFCGGGYTASRGSQCVHLARQGLVQCMGGKPGPRACVSRPGPGCEVRTGAPLQQEGAVFF
jgi:hypothetical protein